MPGIAGIVDLGGRFDLEEKTGIMLSRMKHEPWYLVDRFRQGPMAMGRATLGIIDPYPQPVFNHDRSLCLTMYGEVYSYPAGFSQVQQANSHLPPRNHPLSVLKLIEERGVEALQHLNGSFALALWDSRANKLTLANDRFGLRPLYWFRRGDLLVFASEMKSLLAFSELKREVDLQALAHFLSLNAILEDRTLFSEVKTLPPASLFAFQNGKVSKRCYWTLSPRSSGKGFDRKEYLERAHFLVKQAVQRQLGDEFSKILSLSGGLDSRTILGAAAQLGYNLPTFTFGTAGCPDQMLARRVAEVLGMENRFHELSPAFLTDWAEPGVWLTEGMNNCVNFHGVDFVPQIKKEFSIVINGFLGGELFGFLSFTSALLLFQPNSGDWIRRLFRRLNHPFSIPELRAVLRREYRQETEDSAIESFTRLMKDCAFDSPFDKFYYFRFRELAPKSFLYGLILDNNLVEYRVPFADYDLVDFVSQIPPKQKALAIFHRRLLTDRFAPLGSIPYQRTGLPVSSGPIGICLRKIKDVVKGKVLQSGADQRRYSDYDEWMRNELRGFVTSILLSERFLNRGYFSPDGVRRLVEQHLSGKQNLALELGSLLTFELWNRLFMDGT